MPDQSSLMTVGCRRLVTYMVGWSRRLALMALVLYRWSWPQYRQYCYPRYRPDNPYMGCELAWFFPGYLLPWYWDHAWLTAWALQQSVVFALAYSYITAGGSVYTYLSSILAQSWLYRAIHRHYTLCAIFPSNSLTTLTPLWYSLIP